MTSATRSARPTCVEVDLDALASNFLNSKTFIGDDLSYMAVVKADAYGHGACRCAEALEEAGVDWFGVAIPEEGVELRKAGISRPILCLGSFWPGQAETIIENELTTVIFSARSAADLNNAAVGRAVDVHIKVDTGMGRVGVRYDRLDEFLTALKPLSNIRVRGVMTHLASAEDHTQDAFTSTQLSRLNDAISAFRSVGHDIRWIDAANSPGAIGHPDSRRNLVRLGGALYGLLDDILENGADRPQLSPVLSLRSEIADIKDLPPGETLGYGRTFETKRRSRIALVPVGYADGLPRALSNRAEACVAGTRVPIVGRISMDWTMLDVTDVPEAGIGSTVTLIGEDGGCRITAAELAGLVDTIGYEITCGIGPRVRRVYV